jgi:DNA gyrase subunit A
MNAEPSSSKPESANLRPKTLIPNQQAMVIITKSGYVKRFPPDTYKTQGRGGKGVIGMTTKEEDVVEWLKTTNTHDDILFFTNKGRVFQTKVYELPEGSRTARGQALVNFLELPNGEMVSSILTISKKTPAKFLMLCTKQGLIKKTPIEEFAKVRRSGLIAIKLKTGDELRWVKYSTGTDDVIFLPKVAKPSALMKKMSVRWAARPLACAACASKKAITS